MVEHSIQHPKVEGLNLATTDAEREKKTCKKDFSLGMSNLMNQGPYLQHLIFFIMYEYAQ